MQFSSSGAICAAAAPNAIIDKELLFDEGSISRTDLNVNEMQSRE